MLRNSSKKLKRDYSNLYEKKDSAHSRNIFQRLVCLRLLLIEYPVLGNKCHTCTLSTTYILQRSTKQVSKGITYNIRSAILEIKNGRCKIVKILIFRSLSREHFQSEREQNISILTILHLSFLISNMTLLILLFVIKLLARLSIFKYKLYNIY